MAKGAAVGGLFGGGENQTQPGIITAEWHEIDMDNLSYKIMKISIIIIHHSIYYMDNLYMDNLWIISISYVYLS